MKDFREANLSPRMRALGDYALKLTLTPAQIDENDVVALREIGLSDEEILSANLVTSYFNFINRVADGLGVDLEPWMEGRTLP